VSALFAGPSSTGKTIAAEVVATNLELDFDRIDFSPVVSKYVGETEKNFPHMFAEAQHNEAILIFDEDYTLPGKRIEVPDPHDSDANLRTSYLLQHMEALERDVRHAIGCLLRNLTGELLNSENDKLGGFQWCEAQVVLMTPRSQWGCVVMSASHLTKYASSAF
jgi:SpoVK/Ycf46/Vps4 family AAA+-type ATPase